MRGFVIQIIKPEDQGKYFEPMHGFIDGKYHLVVLKPGIPKNYFMRCLYCIWYRYKIEDIFDYVALDSCPYKKGEWVDLDVVPFYKKTDLFVEVVRKCT